MTQFTFDPEAHIPFYGFRRFDDGGTNLHDLVPSLVHFYESEKFRGQNEDLRIAVLDARSHREVRKITKRHAAEWRSDWKRIRGRVFRAGLAMQVMQSQVAMRAAKEGFQESLVLASTKRIGGLPGTFISNELQAFFQNPNAVGSTRLGVIALNGCVPQDIDERLGSLFAKEKPVSAAIYAGKDADCSIERWCALNAVPVRLTSIKSARLREDDAGEVTARVNTLLTCMPNRRSGPAAILAAAKSKRPRIKVVDLAASSDAK